MTFLRGTGVALVTPFTAAGAVDEPALRAVVRHLVEGGVEYIIPLGTTGESVTLSAAEQQLVLNIVFEEVGGKLPILIGCGGNDTAEVARRLAGFTKAFPEADGFLSVSPAYNRPTQQGIYAHFEHLLGFTDKPLVLYNVPGRTASNVLPETVLQLAHAFPQIVAVKEASASIEQGMAILKDKPAAFHVISGDDSLALAQVAVGYSGVISVLGNAFPSELSTLIRAALQGELDQARGLHYRLLPVMNLLFREGNPVGIKAALDVLNICGPHVRLPLLPASPILRAQLQEAIRAV
jgi:4-hydroxy-tetrahydrodipicolinate synthase